MCFEEIINNIHTDTAAGRNKKSFSIAFTGKDE